MIYGHYDVQPVDPLELWESPPFQPRIVDGVVFARGAADNKGQIFAHVLGIEETIRKSGELPVNLILLVEGEEEIGSAHLEEFLLANREALRCDLIAISDTGMIALTTAEIARLLGRPALPGAAVHWLAFRRRHQARARWYHQRTRLTRTNEI